jgi:hypothetical protein
LENTEIVDILENSVPSTRSKQMVLKGFGPMEHSASDFVAFYERHNYTEGTWENSKVPKKEAKPKGSLKNTFNNAKMRGKTFV